MKKILILGAGKSSYNLIQYLLQYANTHQHHIVVGDFNQQAAQERIAGYTHCASAVEFDAQNPAICNKYVSESDLVVSLLPPALHIHAAKACLKWNKSLFTASYVSTEIKALDAEARSKDLLLMNELGLDPGIDHLSAMKIIHHLQQQGANITSFKSYTGGLVAPEYDNNPWNYKFTWNPRNVVLAGQGVAKYIVNNDYKYVPYHRLFTDIQTISVKGYGNFDGYPNRDSLSYREVYGLENIPTMLRGTLRKEGFCEAWNVFVQLGITDDSYKLENSQQMTYRQFIDAYLPANNSLSVEERLKNVIGNDKKAIFDKIVWLGLLTNMPIPLQNASPAQILQHVLEQKWALGQEDKDMIVMQHIFEYELKGKKHELYSSLVVKGDNIHSTAMAKTVGLPLAMGAKLYLEGKLDGLSGVHVPIMPMLYEPILEELASMGIVFQEEIS